MWTRRPRECRAAKRLDSYADSSAPPPLPPKDRTRLPRPPPTTLGAHSVDRLYRDLRNQKRDAFWSATIAANQSIVITSAVEVSRSTARPWTPACEQWHWHQRRPIPSLVTSSTFNQFMSTYIATVWSSIIMTSIIPWTRFQYEGGLLL